MEFKSTFDVNTLNQLLVEQIKSVSHENFSLNITNSIFAIHVHRDPFSHKISLLMWKKKDLFFTMVV